MPTWSRTQPIDQSLIADRTLWYRRHQRTAFASLAASGQAQATSNKQPGKKCKRTFGFGFGGHAATPLPSFKNWHFFGWGGLMGCGGTSIRETVRCRGTVRGANRGRASRTSYSVHDYTTTVLNCPTPARSSVVFEALFI